LDTFHKDMTERIALPMHSAIGLSIVIASALILAGGNIRSTCIKTLANNGTRQLKPGKTLANECASLKLETQCKNWAVVSTRKGVTDAVRESCEHLHGWCMLIVSGVQASQQYSEDMTGCIAVVIDERTYIRWSTSCRVLTQFPWNDDYRRKNIAYLAAMANGAERVWDFDEHTKLLGPYPTAFEASPIKAWTLPAYRHDVLNPYLLLGADARAWPRGFPSTRIAHNATTPLRDSVLEGEWARHRIGIVQSMTHNQPDVTEHGTTRPTTFSYPKDTILVVPRETLAPLNTYATLFRPSALWALLLPQTVNDLHSDTWRGYIMQRLLADYGFEIAFTGAWAERSGNVQTRSTREDFNGLLSHQTYDLITFLRQWQNNGQNLPGSALDLYVKLQEHGFIGVDDVVRAKSWFSTLRGFGYVFPRRPPFATILVRTYHQDITRMNKWLLPTIKMFVNPLLFHFVVVLDDESAKDHALGTCLEAHGIDVIYEQLPSNSSDILLGRAFAATAQYNRTGYDRQQWSKFYVDRQTESR
jgi:hypothetical protein